MTLRKIAIDPELHRRIKVVASKKDMSMKDWVESILVKEVEKEEALNGQ